MLTEKYSNTASEMEQYVKDVIGVLKNEKPLTPAAAPQAERDLIASAFCDLCDLPQMIGQGGRHTVPPRCIWQT